MQTAPERALPLTLIGLSNSGKTCFLEAMAGVFQSGVEGFTLGAVDHSQELELLTRWEKMITQNGQARFPKANDQTFTYAFDFSCGFEIYAKVEWHDYRGVAVTERFANDPVLMESLQQGGSLIILVAADVLMSDALQVGAQAEIRIINSLLGEIARRSANRKLPFGGITIAVTKADHFHRHGIAQDLVQERVKTLFNALFAMETPILVSFVTLGQKLEDSSGYNGEIQPIGFHRPLAFAVERWLSATSAELQHELQQWRNEEAPLASQWFPDKAALATIRNQIARIEDEIRCQDERIMQIRHELLSDAEVHIRRTVTPLRDLP